MDVVQNRELLKKMAKLKHKETLRESLQEHSRRGNFIRIFPAKGTDCYDPYFTYHRPLNRFLYKVLFSEELQCPIEPPKHEKGETIVVSLRMNGAILQDKSAF